MSSMVPIDKVVRDACREAGDTDYKYYMAYLQFANDAFRDLTLYVVPSLSSLRVRTEKLSCGQNQIIDLPDDFVYETKVGICKGNRIFVLTLNEDICQMPTASDANCDCQVEQEMDNFLCGGNPLGAGVNYLNYTFYNYWTNGNLGELYGAGLGFNIWGHYKIERSNNRILVSGVPQDSELVIEYKSNGVGSGAELIPTEAENVIREYIMWKAHRIKNRGVSLDAHRNYKIEYNRLKKLYSSYTEQDWHQVLLNNTTPAIKN